MIDEIRFHEVTSRYVNCKYALANKDEGFDCLTMLYDFYGSLGVNLPREWNGWTLTNYAERWQRGEGRKEFSDFLMTLGIEVEKNFMRRGDLIVFDGRLSGPSIYLGNGNAIKIFDVGGMVHALGPLRSYIVSVRRLLSA